MKFLLIDNYDSFTFMLADYVKQCGVVCNVVRNDNPLILNKDYVLAYDAFILSPGPKTPAESGLLLPFIEQFNTLKPMLGVCLGHQAIGIHFGAVLTKAIQPRHGKVDLIVKNTLSKLFHNLPQEFYVTRYHSLVLKQIKSPLIITAKTLDGECMALEHKELPIYGVQFHPESCQTSYGLNMIQNFCELVQTLHLPIK